MRGGERRADDLPCVWMTAGVINFKLCDREYACDGCPLDRALRGATRPADGPSATAWVFPDDRRYHRAHGWVRPLDDGTARCGLDALAALLLAPQTSLVLPAPGSRLGHGRTAWWSLGPAGPVPLRAPVSGRVTRRNPALRGDPGLTLASPYDEGWLVELVPDPEPRQAPTLLDGKQMARRADRQLERLRRRLARVLAPALRRVGPTLADGGEPFGRLWEMVGPERYLRLIQLLLS